MYQLAIHTQNIEPCYDRLVALMELLVAISLQFQQCKLLELMVLQNSQVLCLYYEFFMHKFFNLFTLLFCYTKSKTQEQDPNKVTKGKGTNYVPKSPRPHICNKHIRKGKGRGTNLIRMKPIVVVAALYFLITLFKLNL